MLSAVPVGDAPVCDVNRYDAETNADPYDAYRATRDAGPQHDTFRKVIASPLRPEAMRALGSLVSSPATMSQR